METRQYLNQLRNIDRRIKDKIADSQKWMDIAISRSIGSSGGADDVRVQSTPKPDKISDAVAKSVDYKNEADAEAVRLVELKHTIEWQIDKIEDETYRNILRGYYVDEKSLNQIAVEESYSYKNIKRKFDKAIEDFREKYGELYNLS